MANNFFLLLSSTAAEETGRSSGDSLEELCVLRPPFMTAVFILPRFVKEYLLAVASRDCARPRACLLDKFVLYASAGASLKLSTKIDIRSSFTIHGFNLQ